MNRDKPFGGEIDMSPQEKEQKKIERICEMFPEADAALVQDCYY
jgi:hypothetical protein